MPVWAKVHGEVRRSFQDSTPAGRLDGFHLKTLFVKSKQNNYDHASRMHLFVIQLDLKIPDHVIDLRILNGNDLGHSSDLTS